MALRDKLRDRVQPHLEPGEKITQIFLGQTGPSPWWVMVTWLILIFGAKYRVVAVTDRAIRVFSASGWVPSKPKELIQTLPLNTTMSNPSGLWAKVNIGSEEMWVHKRFHGDVNSARAALGR